MTEPDPEQGINLSHHETVPDWKAMRAGGVLFASVTVSEGMNWSDPAASRQAVEARRAGIHTGARHCARPSAVHEQATHFVRTGEQLDAFAPGSLAPALDVRFEGVDDRFIRGWIKAVRRAAKVQRVLIYADFEQWAHRLHPDKWADSEVVLWLTRHNGIPGRPGWFHSRLGIHQHDAGPGGAVGHDSIVYPFTLADMLL
ncbi:lysozyme [Amycolatopsis antarctica]|uniref:Lysozyme n=1 Tax=Amycolatopsis antarctica TaxID=1854586 RepID=A0A263D505_9PSEU|nr:GH25 family lysozyme [Amycolatopsis antarctica]OZM73513.1 lysozyme [Amycolatopsis antarctica]